MFHVKHLAEQDLVDRILADACELGVELGRGHAQTMVRHLLLVEERSSRVNLTAVHNPADAVSIHVLDSLSGMPAMRGAPDGLLVDLGAGAGFPGIPLCVASGRRAVLVESIGKKADFLSEAVSMLSIDATVFRGRAEEYALERPEARVVTCRALAELPVLLELGAPLLAEGGLLIAYKGRLVQEEMDRGRRAAARVGLRPEAVIPVAVPGIHAARVLVVFRRTGVPEIELPRRSGMARKRPLA